MSRLRQRELLPYLLLMAAGLALRLVDLGDRPFHHDESQDAYFSWVFYDRGEYAYDPLLHGPVRFYLTALVYLLAGDSDFTARLAPALMGTVLIGLPFLLRRQVGNVAALVAAALLAFGPTFLYFSRFAREDIYISAINLALFAAVFRFLDRPTRWGPALILGLTAAAFATKETTYITLFVSGTFLVPAAVIQARRGRPGIWDAVRSVGGPAWGYGAASFALVFTLLFTVFLTNPPGLWDGLYDALAYWLAQQPVARGGEPWYFYFVVLVAHEWPVLLLGAVGAAAVIRRPTTIGLFLIWAFVMSMAVYSWASEKFAWLLLHPLLPLVFLAGIGVQALWRARRAVAVPVIAVCAAYLAYSSFSVNALHRADPREFLVSTQSSEAVKRVADQVRAMGRPTVTVDTREGATFPWAWYFRSLPAGYADMAAENFEPKAKVLLVTEASRLALGDRLDGYTGRRFPFRVWWVRDYSRALDFGAWWDWLVHREPWNPTGGMPEYLYVRDP